MGFLLDNIKNYKKEWIVFIILLIPIFVLHTILLFFIPLTPLVIGIDLVLGCCGLGLPVFAWLTFGWGRSKEELDDSTWLVTQGILIIFGGTCFAAMVGMICFFFIAPIVCSCLVFAPVMNCVNERFGKKDRISINYKVHKANAVSYQNIED